MSNVTCTHDDPFTCVTRLEGSMYPAPNNVARLHVTFNNTSVMSNVTCTHDELFMCVTRLEGSMYPAPNTVARLHPLMQIARHIYKYVSHFTYTW